MLLRKTVLCGTTALIAAAGINLAKPAMAQDGARLEEIVVTARKQEESLQDIPVSIQAFTAREISRRGITDLTDVAAFTAGLTFEDYASSALEAPVIRGLAQTRLNNPVQNVATFLDGIYLQRSYMIDIGFLDTQRIEVVKGPQSALYGRNAFAGAINYISQGPTEEFEAAAEVIVGSDERFGAKGSVSGPIVPDILFGRIAYGVSQFDGTWENNHPLADQAPDPGTKGNVGGEDNDTFQVQLEARPLEGVTLSGMYYRTEINQESVATNYITGLRGTAFGLNNVNQLNCGFGTAFGFLTGNQLLCGEFDAPDEDSVVVDPRAYGQWGVNEVWRAEGTYEFADVWTFNFLYGRTESDITSAGQSVPNALTGTTGGFLPAGLVFFDSQPNGGLESNQYDARIEYNDNGLRALAGYFYSDTSDVYIARAFQLPPLGLDPLVGPLDPDTGTINEDEVMAFYGLAEYDITSAITVSAEIRYTEEEKVTIGTSRGQRVTQSETFEYWTPRFSADWQVTDESLIYASAAKGVKAGGFNNPFLSNSGNPIDPSQAAFDPEENWTYEIGAKNAFLGGDLIVNLAAFYVDWSELQISESPIGSNGLDAVIIGNVGGASSLGVELDGAWAATDNLTFTYAFTYLQPEFDDGVIYQEAVIGGWCVDGTCPADGDIGGNTLPRTSEVQGALGVQWQAPLTDQIDYFARGDVTYQSKQYLTNLNVGNVPSRTLVNTRLGLESENWDLEFWVRNLFDEEYVSSSLFLGFANAYVGALGPKRSWGLTGRVRF